jgi:argininosuccinate lyase
MIREGRLGRNLNKDAASFSSSLEFDTRLFEYDILNDLAHLVMLTEQGIVERDDARKILKILRELDKKGIAGVERKADLEDIHMAVEAHLIRELGDIGGRLHTGRSRNDQVACDLRMKARADANKLSKAVIGLIIALLESAEKNTHTLIPAYTHLQHAQPTTLAHHQLSYVDSLLRSLDRLEEAYRRIDLCPLGAAAGTSTSFPINRIRTSELLGFSGILENTLDAVSSRDYMIEVLSIDISRMAEELILWTTSEFSFIELSDSFATTSSIMPQKKNPDVLEIIRARTATTIGSLTSVLIILRSLPQSYNRDLQELSPLFFRSLDEVSTSLLLLGSVIGSMKIRAEKMNESCLNDFSTATDLADLLVRDKGIPFRAAHQIVGALVSRVLKEGVGVSEISPELLDKISLSIIDERLGIESEQLNTALCFREV